MRAEIVDLPVGFQLLINGQEIKNVQEYCIKNSLNTNMPELTIRILLYELKTKLVRDDI